ncbi:MAG: TlpA family protein disulfide reductase [Oceanidesulfovibrio sp.]
MSMIPRGPVRSLLALVLGLAVGVGGYVLFSQLKGGVDFATGHHMPGLELRSLEGESRSLARLADDKPAVVAVFASWCRYCKPVMRSMITFQDLAAQEGVGVYAVNFGEKQDVVRRTAASLGLEMPVFVDEGNDFAKAMGVNAIPVVFGVAQGGKIRYIDHALPPEGKWREFIDSLR